MKSKIEKLAERWARRNSPITVYDQDNCYQYIPQPILEKIYLAGARAVFRVLSDAYIEAEKKGLYGEDFLSLPLDAVEALFKKEK